MQVPGLGRPVAAPVSWAEWMGHAFGRRAAVPYLPSVRPVRC